MGQGHRGTGRGGGTLSAYVSDLGLGFRMLRRAPGFATSAIVALALGIGSSTASFSLVRGVLLEPLPWLEPERLIELRELGEGRVFYPSYPNFDDWRTRSRSLSIVAVQPLGEQPTEGPDGPARASVLGISRGFFETLGVPPSSGRTFSDEENAPGGAAVMMVSHAFWRDRLGAPAVLEGVTVRTFGEDFRVVGVASPEHRFVQEADLYIPLERWPGTIRSAHAYRVFGRMSAGVTLEAAAAEMNGIAAAIRAEHPGESQAESVRIQPLPEVMLGDYRRPLTLLLGAAALVLLVVSVNVGSTLLARGMDRARELSVRISLGAGRARLVRQLLLEALVLAAIGGGLGVALAAGFVGGAVRLAPDVLPRVDGVAIDGGVLAFAILLTVGTTLLCGLLPALRLTRVDPSVGVGLGSRAATREVRGWGWALGAEAALAVVLLIGAGLMLRSVRHIVEQPSNWSHEGVLEIRFGFPSGMFASEEEGIAFVRTMLAEAVALPGVAAAGLTNRTPLGGGDYTAPAADPSREENPENYSGWRVVDRGYFRTLGIPLVRGRLWAPGEADAAVVNESLARRLWPGEDPLGRLVTSNFDYRAEPFRVVGVVADARDWRLDAEDQTEMYVPWWSRPEHVQTMTLLVRAAGGDERALVPAVRSRLSRIGPRVAWEIRPLSTVLASTASDRRFVSAVLTTFAVIGGIEALLGILGIVGYSVSRRRREFGVRMALGARSRGIRKGILTGLARSVLPGVLIGLLGAALLSRLLAALIYEISPLDIGVYAAVAVAFTGAALAAGDLPARRAARTHPADILRDE